MTLRFFIGVFTIAFVGQAFAWMAKDTITGTEIDVVWPARPADVGSNGNHEVQYRIGSESQIRLGEATGWLSKCFGKHCPSKQTKNFELNTFSNRGLMYCFPLQ